MTTIAVAKSTIKYEIPIMIAITLLLLLVGMDGTVTFRDGIASRGLGDVYKRQVCGWFFGADYTNSVCASILY